MDKELPNQCTAHSKQSGNRCKNAPIPGGRVCRFHGGAAPQVKAKAAERLKELRDLAVEIMLERFIEERDTVDLRVVGDQIDKLTKQVELLEGRATNRSESVSVERAEAAREQLAGRLDELARKREERLRRTGTDDD